MSDCHGLNSLNGSDTPAAQASISSRCQCTPLATQTLSLCLAERVPWKSLKWDPWQRQMWTLTIPSLCLWRLGNCGVLQVSEALIHLKGLISFQLAGAGYSNFSISHLTTEFDKSQSSLSEEWYIPQPLLDFGMVPAMSCFHGFLRQLPWDDMLETERNTWDLVMNLSKVAYTRRLENKTRWKHGKRW